MQRMMRSWGKIDTFQKIAFMFLVLLAVFMALPIVFIMNHAFKPITELFAYPPTFFVRQPTMENFDQLFLRSHSMVIPFTRYLFNSLLITTLTVISVVFVSAIAAYAFSKHRFPGKNVFFSLTIFALMFAPEAVVIPRYLVIANLGIMNTYFVHILPFIAAPVSVFLMKQFIDQIPKELIEAAKIDGASELRIFSRIVIPVCAPAISTIAILTFQGAWLQTESSVMFTQVESMKTLPYYIMTLTNGLANNVVGQGVAAATTLILFVPNLIIFLVFQRKVIATMAHSGIK
ncbi:carbohydrate ABC transporter permease [Paenibacillus sp.]|uniref:carbohydrate ABC transporter permease n=1 Tax=Paenibacillus sp. TaxID=58172 RepID=UPI0028121416|nr:carbohydrate ABC transporter permease [Paenibacillus sp.]